MREITEEDFNSYGNYTVESFHLLFRGEKIGISKFYISEKIKYKYIFLSLIEVTRSERKKGHGNAFIKQLLIFADTNKLMIILTPSSFFGVEKHKLIKWYQKHGFILNEGINKRDDVLQEMYRNSINE